MSVKKRILFIAEEMSPYLELTEYAHIVNQLAIKANEAGMEVRVIMPRFGVINERRHRLHEVVRLSGINIIIDNDDYPLIIKVASLPNARLQVYFLDNEDFFKRKFVFEDEQGNFFEDNALRAIFFCKGALETVKKFGWPPDIIHLNGWMSALIPLYLKTAYKKEPVFSPSKVIYSVTNDLFEGSLHASFAKKAAISQQVKAKDLALYKEATHLALNRGAMAYADALAIGAEKLAKPLLEELKKHQDKPILPYCNDDEQLKQYLQLYEELAVESVK
ncbi:MAG: glycogen/starch synthase [Thermoflavifilum sp.]|nr:glycogen/starch synthase [Thermoflavifilum sp.]